MPPFRRRRREEAFRGGHNIVPFAPLLSFKAYVLVVVDWIVATPQRNLDTLRAERHRSNVNTAGSKAVHLPMHLDGRLPQRLDGIPYLLNSRPIASRKYARLIDGVLRHGNVVVLAYLCSQVAADNGCQSVVPQVRIPAGDALAVALIATV